jgi:hypothetical protein
MRLSQAIERGSRMIRPEANVVLNAEGTAGCAWGMAKVGAPAEFRQMEQLAVMKRVELPCTCGWSGGGRTEMDLAHAIIHLFDWHVFGVKNWTMTQLINWVRGVESYKYESPDCPSMPSFTPLPVAFFMPGNYDVHIEPSETPVEEVKELVVEEELELVEK